MRFSRAALMVYLVLLAGFAKASNLPPIGQRTYVLDRSAPSAPVKIEKGAAPNAGVYLKDPVSLSGPVKVVPIKKMPPKPKPIAEKPRGTRPGSLRFGKMEVSGHVKHPRVQFSREIMQLDRADEPVAPEFFDKVFEPAKDRDF